MKHILLFLFIFSTSLYAQNDAFDPQKSKGDLYTYAEFTNVGDQDFGIQDIINDASLTYNKIESANHGVGFSTDNHWMRFKLQNSSKNTIVYYLETARPITNIANLYQINNGHIQNFKNGNRIPFSDKQVAHRSTIFKLTLPPQETQQIFIHLKSNGETIKLPLNLYTESSFWLMNYKKQLFYGIFFGLLFLAGILYLLFYPSLKEKTFLYYGIYVFSIALMQAALDGFIHEYMFPNGGYLNDRSVIITGLITNFFVLKYCESFLKIGYHLKLFKKAINFLYGVLAVLFVMVFLNESTLKLTYPIGSYNGVISLLLLFSAIITMYYKRIKVSPYFTLGIIGLIIGFLGFVMDNLNFLPHNSFTLNCAKFGSGAEVIFLSLSMTSLIKDLRLEKDESQQLALKRSEEINQLKTYFMANLSHELRTPINAIMGIAEHELETVKNNQKRKPYEIIKNASLSLLSNINDLIDYERIEKKDLRLNSDDFNPSIKLNQISNNWKAEALKKGLDYKFEMDPEIPTGVYGDADRFIQIINTILSNAIKYTENGSVLFKVRCLKQPNDLCRFSFQISDTGIGIPPETKDTIFDSFSQMKLDHKRKFGGIGLGLNIVKHLVELFGGSITIESKLNKGTDVFIDLILKSVAQERVVVALNDTNELPLHILIVEDNKINQMVMRKILSSFSNISFAVTNNGQEAIDALKKDVYDIVLMDLQMPVMDGYEATRIIRSGELGKSANNIPIIAVTADALQETKKRVLDLGMNDYMTKPVSRDLLYKKIFAFNFDKNNCNNDEPKENLKIA